MTPVATGSTERESYQQELHESKAKIKSLDKDIKLDTRKRQILEEGLKKHSKKIHKLNKKISSLKQQIVNSGKKIRKH